MSKRTWSRSQRAHYNTTMRNKKTEKTVTNIIAGALVLPFVALWYILKWCGKGLVALYYKITKKA